MRLVNWPRKVGSVPLNLFCSNVNDLPSRHCQHNVNITTPLRRTPKQVTAHVHTLWSRHVRQIGHTSQGGRQRSCEVQTPHKCQPLTSARATDHSIISPDNLFHPKAIDSTELFAAISDGKVPVNRLADNPTTVKFSNRNNPAGIVPARLLESSLNVRSACRALMSGTVPLNVLNAAFRYLIANATWTREDL